MKPNRLISITLCAAACLALGQFAGAQTPEEPAPPFHHRPNLIGMLVHTLDLTDAQKTQVEALVKAIQPQLDVIHQQARTAADAVLKQLDTQIRPLLNADQQKKLDALATLRGTGPRGPE